MKKALSLLLALVLCLSLCACGDGQAENTQPKTNGEDSNATTSSSKDTEIIDSNTESIDNGENEYVNHPLYSKLFGTWELVNPDTENAPISIPYDVLIINEDYTCVVDGIEATWDFGNMYGNDTSALEIDIFISGERACGAVLQDLGLMSVTENYALCGTTHFNSSNSAGTQEGTE